MQPDVFGGSYAAIKSAKAAGVIAGSPLYGNQNAPQYITGAAYLPDGLYMSGNTTTTTNRCYYVPLAIRRSHTFQGAMTYNQGVADNGKKIRMMIFRDADGAPGALEKDFGEITLTGASALRTLSSSWAANPGIYWAAIWHDSAAVMYCMQPYAYSSNVGTIVGFGLGHAIGSFDAAFLGGTNPIPHGHYVDTAYGAAPATAVAPTTTLGSNAFSVTGLIPVFGLKG